MYDKSILIYAEEGTTSLIETLLVFLIPISLIFLSLMNKIFKPAEVLCNPINGLILKPD